jgi:predicted transcriptional regulator
LSTANQLLQIKMKEIEIQEIIINKINNHLSEQKKTCSKLAFEASLSKSSLCLILQGKRNASMHTLVKLSEAMKTPLESLFRL